MKATLDGTMKADSRLGADISFDIVKLFGLDTDLKLTFGSVYNDRISALRAYNNSYALGGNVDRIRTVNSGIGFYIDLGYGDLVTGRLGIVPKINEAIDNIGTQHFSATASVLVKPVDGVKVSAGYVYYPDNSAERYLSYDHGDDDYPDAYADHAWAAAVDWDIAGIFDLDFDIDVSVPTTTPTPSEKMLTGSGPSTAA